MDGLQKSAFTPLSDLSNLSIYTERNLYWILREISLNLREISPCLRAK